MASASARRARDRLERRWGNSVPNTLAERAFDRGGQSEMESAVLEYARSRSPSKAASILAKSGGGAPRGQFRSALEDAAGDARSSDGGNATGGAPNTAGKTGGGTDRDRRDTRDKLKRQGDRGRAREQSQAASVQAAIESALQANRGQSTGGGARARPAANITTAVGLSIWELAILAAALVAGVWALR